MKRLLFATALIESGAGLFLLAAPSAFAHLLLGVPLDTAASLTVARVGGAGLLSLAATAWFASFDVESRAARGVVSAMVIYNLAAAIVLGAATFQPAAAAIVLWSVVGLHTVMAVWCVAQLSSNKLPTTPTPHQT